jgi:amino acid permease
LVNEQLFKMNKLDDIQAAPVTEKTDEITPSRPTSESESHDGEKGLPHVPELQRKLKARHLQMIAIGMLAN